MSIINFPQNPTLNELYPFGGKTWQWNGSYWGIYSGSSISIVDINYSASTGELWYTKSDLSQNKTSEWSYFTGGSYDTSTREITLSANTGGTFTITNLDYNGVTNLNFNVANYDLTIERASGNDTVSLSILATDMTVTGGTYNPNNGIVTFTNNSGGTFTVSGFTSGYTDIRTTGVTYTPSTGLLTFNTTTTQNAYSANTAYYVSGTTDYLPKFNSTGITNSIIFNSGSTVGVNNPTPSYLLDLSASTSSDTLVMFDAGNRIRNGNNLSNSRFVSSSDTTEKTSSFNLFDNNSAEFLSNTNNTASIYLERSGTTYNPVTTNAKRNDLVVAQNFNGKSIHFATVPTGNNNGVGRTIRMTIAPNGYVGIGTTTPTRELQTKGNFSIGTGGSGGGIYGALNWVASTNTFTFTNNAGDRGLYIKTNGGVINGSVGAAVIAGVVGSGIILSGDYTIGEASQNQLVLASAGNVGIGTNSPSYKLHLKNGVATNSSAFAGTLLAIESSGNTYCSVLSPDASASGIAFGSDSNRSAAFMNWGYSLNRLAITTNNTNSFITLSTGNQTEVMRLTSTGTVGIGITSPSHSLHVSGTTFCTDLGAELSVQAPNFYPTQDTDLTLNTRTNTGTKNINFRTGVGSGGIGSLRMVITSGGTVGIGTSTPDSTLHVFKGSAGSVTAVGGTNVTIEDSSTNYLSMLAPDNQYSGIVFGSPSDSFGAYIRWRQTDTFLDISTADFGDYIRLGAGNSDIKAYVTSNGFGVNTLPVASAALEISATTQGFLPPRMTNAQITGITSPATGLMAYSTTENLIVYYNGTNWMKITGVTTL